MHTRQFHFKFSIKQKVPSYGTPNFSLASTLNFICLVLYGSEKKNENVKSETFVNCIMFNSKL